MNENVESKSEKKPFYKKWWVWVIVAVVVIAVAFPTDSEEKTDTESDVPQATEEVAENNAEVETLEPVMNETVVENWYTNGMYKVGTDIQAGEYFVLGSGPCYVEVNKDCTGSLDDILYNDNINTFVFVTVQDGQYFTVKNGKFVEAEYAEVPGPEDGVYDEGMYRIGSDIPSGEYKVEATLESMAYLQVSSDSTGDLYSIVSNDNFEGSKYISVSDGQYLTIKNGVIYAN